MQKTCLKSKLLTTGQGSRSGEGGKGVGEYVEDRGPKSDPIEQEREVSSACSWRDEAMMKEEMKEKKMRTMYFHNLEMKEYVKKGTLYEARKTWEVRNVSPTSERGPGARLTL